MNTDIYMGGGRGNSVSKTDEVGSSWLIIIFQELVSLVYSPDRFSIKVYAEASIINFKRNVKDR